MNSSTPGFALVVTADDFGIGLRTSQGIIQAHRHGPVTATSLMVTTGRHVRESIPLLRDSPGLDVGLHVVLTRCGHAPLTAKRSSGLLDRQGNLLSNGRLWLKAFAGKLDGKAIAEEISAQAQLFGQLLGRAPTHVDSHHHAHQLPIIRDGLIDVIGAGLLPAITRTTIEPPGLLRKKSGARSKRLAAHLLGKRAAKMFSRNQIWSNTYYFGMLAQHDLPLDFPWQRFLQNLPQTGIIEWIVHPGLPDETLIGRDDYRAERDRELESLTSPQGIEVWKHLRPFLSRKSVLHAVTAFR